MKVRKPYNRTEIEGAYAKQIEKRIHERET